MYANQKNPSAQAGPELVMAGSCSYSVEQPRVVITIGEIANNREPGNLSGTLSIELWALEEPYQGGGFTGVALAGTQIGELAGQHFLSDCRYDLVYQEPPEGTWNLVLMLREWEGSGFITRVYANFPIPYVVPGRIETRDNVVNVSFTDKEKAAAKSKTVEGQREQGKEQSASRKPAQARSGVSLNRASAEEISGIKGVSAKLAKALVEARPFHNFDEVLKVKGVGAKLLEKLRQHLSL